MESLSHEKRRVPVHEWAEMAFDGGLLANKTPDVYHEGRMLPSFRDPHIDPRRWAPHGEWTPEGDCEAADRTTVFARDFFARLYSEFPSLQEGLVFLRWSVQPDDVYAFFDRPPGFVVQIVPDPEYIIVFGGDGRGEYGDWGNNDRTRDALDHIRSLLGTAP